MRRHIGMAFGLAAAAAIAMACADTANPATPAPTAAALAADQASLKATAPGVQSPVNDQRLTGTSAPTLTASAATGLYTGLTLKYRFQLFGETGALVQDSGLMSAPAFTVTAALSPGKRHTWKVRAEYQGAAGPWSAAASFYASESAAGPSADRYGNWPSCASFASNPPQLVVCVHGFVRPTDTESDFEVVKRVAWLLRNQGGGLLIKNGGENIVSWQGLSFSASRIMFSNCDLFKIISDAGPGGANSPTWQEDIADCGLYVPAIDPIRP